MMSKIDPNNHQSSVAWEALNWHPSEHQISLFCQLQSLLIDSNRTVNLTRLFNDSDYWIGQVLDSLWPLTKEFKKPQAVKRVIDIGTGCGFPGLAIAIAFQNTQVTLVDSVNKKTNAIQAIVKALNLNKRVSILNERAEITGQTDAYRGNYDLATARAVSSLDVVAEYLVPFLNVQGEALIY